MGRPQSNGLVELHDGKLDSKAFMCFDLLNFLHDDEDTKGGDKWEDNFDAWLEKFMQAKNGNCPYRDKCARYAKTIAKRDKQPHQLKLF